MASKRRLRRRGCEGKVGHATAGAAELAARKMRAARDGGTWAAYRCPFCGRFHVGRPNADQRRAMRARRAEAAG